MASSSSGAGAGGPTARYFPTQQRMAEEGLETREEQQAVYNLQRMRLSSRAVKELEEDVAQAPKEVPGCAPLSSDDLRTLIMLAQTAMDVSEGASGGARRRRRHRQRGGALSDAVKGVLRSLCGMFRRGLQYNERQAESAIQGVGQALDAVTDEAAATRINTALRRAVMSTATTAAVYDLARGPEGWIGSLVVGIVSALYSSSPDPATAAASVLGAGQIVGLGAGAVAGTYAGIAAVTYASAVIRRGIERMVDFGRQLPNPTNPEHVHRILMAALQMFPQVVGQIRYGPMPALPPSAGRGGRGALVGTMVIPPLQALAGDVAMVVRQQQQQVLGGGMTDEQISAEFGVPAARIREIRQRNAQRFGAPGGAGAGASAAASSSSAMDESGGTGEGGRRRKTRKQHRRGRRHHTRKH